MITFAVKLKVADAWEGVVFEKQEQAKLFFIFYLEPGVTVQAQVCK